MTSLFISVSHANKDTTKTVYQFCTRTRTPQKQHCVQYDLVMWVSIKNLYRDSSVSVGVLAGVILRKNCPFLAASRSASWAGPGDIPCRICVKLKWMKLHSDKTFLEKFIFVTGNLRISPQKVTFELPILGFRATHFPIRTAHFEKWGLRMILVLRFILVPLRFLFILQPARAARMVLPALNTKTRKTFFINFLSLLGISFSCSAFSCSLQFAIRPK